MSPTSSSARATSATDADRGAMTKEDKANQRNAVLAGFLGWTLDAFDFFVLTLDHRRRRAIVRPIERPDIALAMTRDAGDAAGRRGRLRHHGGSLRPAHAADAERRLLCGHLGALRSRAELSRVPRPADAVRHRHGRRVGRRRVAGARVGVAAAARPAVRPAAGRLRDRQPAGRARVPAPLSVVQRALSRQRLAADVLPRRPAGAAVALHPRRRSRSRRRGTSTGPTGPPTGGRCCSHWRRFVLPRAAHDDDELHVARHAGHVPDAARHDRLLRRRASPTSRCCR